MLRYVSGDREVARRRYRELTEQSNADSGLAYDNRAVAGNRLHRSRPDPGCLGDELELYRALFNQVRPHESLDFRTPLEAYLAAPEPYLLEAESVQET